MPRLLLVHHTVSPPTAELFDEVTKAVKTVQQELDTHIDFVTAPALTASPVDVLNADSILLGTPANIGYMSGALKHFFDQIYYPCLAETTGMPYGLYVHGNSDTVGAVRAVESIAKGLQWQRVAEPVTVTGPVNAKVREDILNLVGLCSSAGL